MTLNNKVAKDITAYDLTINDIDVLNQRINFKVYTELKEIGHGLTISKSMPTCIYSTEESLLVSIG